jgi:hypothetical protein
MPSPNAGGFVDLTINGVPHSIAGELEIEETNFEAEAQVNQDGTVSRTQKPKPFKFMLSIRDRQGPSIVAQLFRDDVQLDVSAVEKQMKRTVLLTGAFATGTPRRNTATGEITGIEICSHQMRIVGNA